MENYYLYKINDKWEWFDSVFMSIATVPQDRVSEYCLEQADNMRNSILENYADLTKKQRERLAKLWEEIFLMENMNTISILKLRKKYSYNRLRNLERS